MSDFEWASRMNILKYKFQDLEKITDKWGFFRQIYMEMIPYIMERSRENVNLFVKPYSVDWASFFSPIEFSAWNSIRSHYVALYPQFPVFNYFIDFANPYLRIGLEMDGKEYHDQSKDRERDEMLLTFGWKIFRIPGRECYTAYQSYHNVSELEYDSEDDKVSALRNWILNSSDGVIYAIKKIYFDQVKEHELFSELIHTLDNHKGADFVIEAQTED